MRTSSKNIKYIISNRSSRKVYVEEDCQPSSVSKDEYVGKKCSSQEVSKIISRLKIKISSLKLKESSQRSRSKITSMQKELQKNSQAFKAPRFKTSQ
ncbi:hypothetical protein Tco_1481782 [Tanacetum coccineum]